ALAAVEQAAHRLNGPAFKAWCHVSAAKRGTSRADVSEQFRQKERTARSLIREVARVAAVDRELAQPARAAPPAPTERPKMIVGKFWEDRLAAERRQQE